MTQEEHIIRCSYTCSGGGDCGGGGGGGDCNGGGGGGGGGCSGGGSSCSKSKKIKKKKVPQRGLGVAQLERIRLEEQQKKEALHATPFLAVQCPNYRPRISPSPNPIHLSPPSPTELPSPNALYRPASSVSNVESLHPSASVLKPPNVGGSEIGLPTISSSGQGKWPKMWNGECNIEGEKQRLNHQDFAFQPHMVLPSEFNTILPLPSVPQQRSQPYQQPSSSSSSLVHASSGISPSYVLTSQMEPPSNQNFCGNNYRPLWPEGDKMVGMKRSYPFSLETPPIPSFCSKFGPTCAPDISRSDESPRSNNRYRAHMEPRNEYISESHSKSCPLPEKNPSEVIRDNGRLNGDFLTLAPPAATSPSLYPKQMHPLRELSDVDCLPGHESTKSQIHRPGSSGSSMEQLSFSFFPTKLQTDQTTTHLSNGNNETDETIDLNLKL